MESLSNGELCDNMSVGGLIVEGFIGDLMLKRGSGFVKKGAWLLVVLILGTLYFLSSIPTLRVLPVLSAINSAMVGLDLTIMRLSEWLTSKVPLNLGELRHIDRATGDFLTYARENPVIIEFLVRKLAHICIFFVITIALFFLLQQYIRSSTLAVICAFLGGTVVAVLDEYRQTFVDGRVGSTVDVFINLIGISLATGLIIFSLFLTWPGRQSFLRRESRKQSVEESATMPDAEATESTTLSCSQMKTENG